MGNTLKIAVLVAALLVTESARAETPISEQAKSHFNAGVALLQDPEGEKVEEAYRQFKTAYDLSGSSKILGNMGFCAMRLERDGEAIDVYSRYLREVPDIDAEERAQIVRDLQTLTVGVVRLTITSDPEGATVIDERVPVRGAHVTNVYGPTKGKLAIGIRPGHHVLTVKAPGRESATWEFDAYTGSKEERAFTLKEPPKAETLAPAPTREERPSYVGPVLVSAVGGAMLVAGGITGLIALNKTNDLEDACRDNICPQNFDLDGQRSSARTFVHVTDLLLLVGAVTLAGGLFWAYRTSATAPPKAGLLKDWRLAF